MLCTEFSRNLCAYAKVRDSTPQNFCLPAEGIITACHLTFAGPKGQCQIKTWCGLTNHGRIGISQLLIKWAHLIEWKDLIHIRKLAEDFHDF